MIRQPAHTYMGQSAFAVLAGTIDATHFVALVHGVRVEVMYHRPDYGGSMVVGARVFMERVRGSRYYLITSYVD